ncbi:MAG: hypothetical protein IT211_07350 [Armatimonadetes bacterium]|nr:hypothetical protein [Armatimonadota bacterium]
MDIARDRLTVTRGVSENVFDIRPDAEPTIAIQLRPLLHFGDYPESITTAAGVGSIDGVKISTGIVASRMVEAYRQDRERRAGEFYCW